LTVIRQFERSISAKEDIQWYASQNLLNFIHSTVLVAGVGGTHAACAYNIHQNVNLMMIHGKIADYSADNNIPLKEHTHCLAKIICNPP